MQWVTIGTAHWNTDHIQAFNWFAGRLVVWWRGVAESEGPEEYIDPDRVKYLQLCAAVGVAPLEVGAHGKS